MLERLKRWGVRLYGADGWAAYAELIPQGRLYVGEEETHGIERDHTRQRHWLARFRRRSIVGSVRSCATALADEGWLLLRTVAVLGILEAA